MDFSEVYGQTNVCTRLLSSERCNPLTQMWLTSFTGELKIIVMKLIFVASWKCYHCIGFPSLKRKIFRSLDTWKKTQVYNIRCAKPELDPRNHPSVATCMWWRVCLFSGSPPQHLPPPSLCCKNACHTCSSVLCMFLRCGSLGNPAAERWGLFAFSNLSRSRVTHFPCGWFCGVPSAGKPVPLDLVQLPWGGQCLCLQQRLCLCCVLTLACSWVAAEAELGRCRWRVLDSRCQSWQ